MSKVLPNVRTLIIDDVRAPREVLRRLLPELGINLIQEATGGKEALYKLGLSTEESKSFRKAGGKNDNQEPFQLVISDFHLPDVTGLDVLREVRKNHRLRNIPFIMITSEVDREEFLAAKEAGVTGYILKPFSLDSVRDSLQGVFCNPRASS